MKKFLLSLAVLFAAGAVAQKQYKTSEMLTEIPDGESFLLAADPDGNSFLTTDGSKNLTTAADDNSLIIFEATGEQTADGDDLYAIKFEATNEYIQDQLITDGMDSSDMLNYTLPYFTTTADLGSAAKWTILPAETRYKATKGDDGWERNWRTYTANGTGTDTEESTGNLFPYEGAFVIMRDKLTEGGADPVYLEPQSDYTFFAPWGDTDWFIFTYEEKTVDDLLQEFWDTNFPEGPEALGSAVGDKVGQYKEESVAGLVAAYEAYTNWLIDGVGEAEDILAQSKAAYEALEVNEMVDGYYYLVAKRENSGVMDDNGVMRGVANFEIPRKDDESIDLTLESSRYLWYFTENPEKGTYTIKNFGTGKYVKTSAHNDNTGIKTGDIADAVDYTVVYSEEFPGTVIFKHFNDKGERDCSWNYFWTNGKVIGNWYPEDDGNSFFLYNVDEALVEAIEDEVAQYELNMQLQELYSKATSDYSKGVAYEPEAACTKDDNFSNRGYLFGETKTVDEVDETTGETTQVEKFVSNLAMVDNAGVDCIMHPGAGDGDGLPALFDGNFTNHCHSTWSGNQYPYFFEVDLGEGTQLEAIAVKFMRRLNSDAHNGSFTSGEMIVFGRNSLDEEWTQCSNMAITYDINVMERDADGNVVVNEETGEPTVWKEKGVGIGSCGLGAKYRYLRLQHYKTCHKQINGANNLENTYFSGTEIALFAATYAPEKSLNGAVPAEILAAIETEMAKAKAELEAGKATAAQIAALQEAYNEFLANFPEPSRLKNALNAAKSLAENLPVDDAEVGYYPQAALDAYNAVIAEVEGTVADVMTLETINTGVAKLDAAKAELLKSLNMFATGFYQLKMAGGGYEEALMHSSRVAADTKEVKGLRAEFAKQTGNVDEGLVDDENYISKVSSVWYFEVGENNKVAIRSLANGLYLQPVLANFSYVQMTPEKAWFEVQADGLKNGGYYNFIVGTDTVPATAGRPLYANINSSTSMQNGYLVSWFGADGSDNSTMKIEEVDLANFAYGENTFVFGNNKTQFFTLPYDAVMYSQDAKVCEVEGFYTDEETGEMAFYFKNIQEDGAVVKGGQAYLVQTDANVDFLTVSFEEEEVTGFENFNYTYEAKVVNGLKATIFSEEVNPNYGVLNIANRIVATTNTESNGEEVLTTIAPLAGYIDATNMPVLDAAPEGEEYVKIVSLVAAEGLTAIEGVEVAPAAKSGIYTISGVRLNSAKNLPAGIYVINGKKVVK